MSGRKRLTLAACALCFALWCFVLARGALFAILAQPRADFALSAERRAAPEARDERVNLSEYTISDYMRASGVGKVIAGDIAAYASAHPRVYWEDLLRVRGVGQARLDALRAALQAP